MEFQQIINKRKSIRTYADTPIPQDVLDHILQVGELAPTSRNLKPCTFHPVQDREVLRKLSKAKKAGAAFAADAAAAIVVAADSEKADTWIEDSSIAMTYMMLAAEEQNLGCCWVQVHLRRDENGRDAEENVREILGLPEQFRVVGFLALGNITNNTGIQ
ncbi:MAG: nitroreductase family protein [Oscillospiraceae bacterium]|nr:nitroreductase family protein [Oscillospiraceae bacterium]